MWATARYVADLLCSDLVFAQATLITLILVFNPGYKTHVVIRVSNLLSTSKRLVVDPLPKWGQTGCLLPFLLIGPLVARQWVATISYSLWYFPDSNTHKKNPNKNSNGPPAHRWTTAKQNASVPPVSYYLDCVLGDQTTVCFDNHPPLFLAPNTPVFPGCSQSKLRSFRFSPAALLPLQLRRRVYSSSYHKMPLTVSPHEFNRRSHC